MGLIIQIGNRIINGDLKPSHAIDFGRAAINQLKSGERLLNNEEIAPRILACSGCPANSNNWCDICGCNLELKWRFPLESCPSGYWGPIIVNSIIPPLGKCGSCPQNK